MSEHRSCAKCGLSFPDLTPQFFSFNSPQGMCADCNGLGTKVEMDPVRIVPDPSVSIEDGAVVPWGRVREGIPGGQGRHSGGREALQDRPQATVVEALEGAPEGPPFRHRRRAGRAVLEVAQRKRDVPVPVRGSGERMLRRLRESTSEAVKRWASQFMSDRICPTCGGGRLRKEAAGVKVGGKSLVELTALTIRDAAGFSKPCGSKATAPSSPRRSSRKSATASASSSTSASATSPRPPRAVALRRRIAAHPARFPDRQRADRRHLHSRRALDRPPPEGQRQADRGAETPPGHRQLDSRRRARPGDDGGVGLDHRLRPRRRRPRRPRRRRRPAGADRGGREVADGAVSLRRARDSDPRCPPPGTGKAIRIAGAAENNLKGSTCRSPSGNSSASPASRAPGSPRSSIRSSTGRRQRPARLRPQYRTARRHQGLEHVDKVVDIDQTPIGRTPRSNPSTYTKAFDPIRDFFAMLPDPASAVSSPGASHSTSRAAAAKPARATA